MTTFRRRLVAVLVIAALIAACGGGTSSSAPVPVAPQTVVPGDQGDGSPLAALEVTAENLAFAPSELVGPAGVPFTITMWNRDDGVPHNILIRAGLPANDVAPSGPDLFAGEIVAGPRTVTYEIPALPAGSYTFACQVHPNMIGTLALR
jgi:plastocyanin